MARDRDTDDLATLLDELRTTLDDLDRALERQSDEDRIRPPARPRGGDVVRFTEEYTIPTVISVLETTISSLELLQGVLRLANPDRQFSRRERTGSNASRGLDRVDSRVRDGTERALEDLRQVLTGTEPPTDPVARDVFEEARALTAEIESILDESRRDSSRAGRRRSETAGESRQSVVIPVDDEGTGVEDADDGDGASDTTTTEEEEDEGVNIDVDAELESIRDEVASESSVVDDEEESDSGEPSRGDKGGAE